MAALVVVGLTWAAGTAHGLIEEPLPPACTSNEVGDITSASPRIVSPRSGLRLPLEAGTDPPVILSVRASGATGGAAGAKLPDLLLVDLQRGASGRVVRSYGQSNELGAEFGPVELDDAPLLPSTEATYTVRAVAVYEWLDLVSFTAPACSIETRSTFSVFRRVVGPATVRTIIRGLTTRLGRTTRGVTSGSGLRRSAAGLRRDIEKLAVLRLRTPAATRALARWVAEALEWAETIDAVGRAAENFTVPSQAMIEAVRRRGQRVIRATVRLNRELDRLSTGLASSPEGVGPTRGLALRRPLSWGAMADLAELTTMIETALPGATAEVVDQGGGDHLAAVVVAPQFAGLSRLEQHRLVYAAVQSRLDDGSIHALALRTRAPEAT
jgi:stress-induced morphogen